MLLSKPKPSSLQPVNQLESYKQVTRLAITGFKRALVRQTWNALLEQELLEMVQQKGLPPLHKTACWSTAVRQMSGNYPDFRSLFLTETVPIYANDVRPSIFPRHL